MNGFLSNLDAPFKHAVFGAVFGLLAFLAMYFTGLVDGSRIVGLVILPSIAGFFGGKMKVRRDKDR